MVVNGGQATPTYAGIQSLRVSANWVYMQSSGLPYHVIGPWYFDAAKTDLFLSWPSKMNVLVRFPRVPVPAVTKEPTTLGAGSLTALEDQLNTALARARSAAKSLDADVFLGGILPSIQLADLVIDNLTPLPRYRELDRLITTLCGGDVRTFIQGRDNLQLSLQSVMLETCNTSIQIHLQMDLEKMSRIYNIAQLASGPVVAAAANSPLLLQHRLWHETRIPTFEQSVDIRSTSNRQRDTWQRVHFGDDWVSDNILDVYRDQIARHRITRQHQLHRAA